MISSEAPLLFAKAAQIFITEVSLDKSKITHNSNEKNIFKTSREINSALLLLLFFAGFWSNFRIFGRIENFAFLTHFGYNST